MHSGTSKAFLVSFHGAWSSRCHTTWQENGLDTNKEAIVKLFTHMRLINSQVWRPQRPCCFLSLMRQAAPIVREHRVYIHTCHVVKRPRRNTEMFSEPMLPERGVCKWLQYYSLIFRKIQQKKKILFFSSFHMKGIIMIKQSHTSYWSKYSPWLQKKSLSIKSSRRWINSSAPFAEIIRMYIMRRWVPCH